MITKNTYYRGDIFIPQAKPSITEEAINPDDDFAFMASKYEEDCLIKCLGPILYRELIANMDLAEDTYIVDGADVKWGLLMNGHNYVRENEEKTNYWRGIRFKSPLSSADYNSSFLAYYVYWFYQRKQYITTLSIGTGKDEGENVVMTAPTMKVTAAWNKFVELVQGKNTYPTYYNITGMWGVDYYSGSDDVSLYQFIRDMKDLNGDDYYADFEPTSFTTQNEFGL